MNLRRFWGAVSLMLCLFLAGCGTKSPSEEAPPSPESSAAPAELLDYSGWEEQEYYTLQLNGDSLISNASSLETSAARVTITEPGIYLVTGKLDDAQIVINVQNQGVVQLVLSDVSLHYSRGPAIHVQNADRTVLYLPDGSDSTISDDAQYLLAGTNAEPDAAVYSKGDLILTGLGSLTVSGRYQNAVTGRETIAISGGNYHLTAQKDGIRGGEEVIVAGGRLHIESGEDGIKSDSAAKDKGNVLIQSGILTVEAGGDGIEAENTVTLAGGSVTLNTGTLPAAILPEEPQEESSGTAPKEPGEEPEPQSAVGVKAGRSVNLTGGILTINSEDHGVDSGETCRMSGGVLKISAGPHDGIRARRAVTVSEGTLYIKESGTGLRSASFLVDGGTVELNTSAVGISAGRIASEQKIGGHVTVNGGTLRIHSGEDGIDSGDAITINGGLVIIDGPNDRGGGAFRYDEQSGGRCSVNGGTVLALCGWNRAMTFDESSEQCSFSRQILGGVGSIIILRNEAGEEIFRYTTPRGFDAVIFSSPQLKTGGSCTLSVNGQVMKIPLRSVSNIIPE